MTEINPAKDNPNFVDVFMIGWAYVFVFGCLFGAIILFVRSILKF